MKSWYHDEQEIRTRLDGQPEYEKEVAISESWDAFVWGIHEYIKTVEAKRLYLRVWRPDGAKESTSIKSDADEVLNLFNFYKDFTVDATQQDDQLVIVATSEGQRTSFILTGAKQ